MTCCATPLTRRSPRPGAGCCTGGSRKASSCCTPTTPTRSPRSSPPSTPGRAARPRRWPSTGGPPQVATGRFAHAEAVRLYREALAVTEAMPAGRDRDGLELVVLTALAAPLTAREGYASRALERDLQRSAALAESLGRGNLVQAALTALSTVWFVQGRTADSHRVATRALALADPGSSAAMPGAVHHRRGGHPHGQARRGPASPGGRGQPGRQHRPAQRGDAGQRARDGLGRARALAARRGRGGRPGGRRRGRPGPRDRRPVQPGHRARLQRRHPPAAPRPAPARGTSWPGCASCASGTSSPTTASGR